MAAVFDATSYFTRRQADLRYVRRPLSADDVAGLFLNPETGEGTFPGGYIAPGTVTSAEIANEVNALLDMLGPNSQPIKLIGAEDPWPDLPDGALVSKAGVLYLKRAGVWEKAVRAPDLSGVLNPEQLEGAIQNISAFAAGLRPIQIVESLPSIVETPPGSGNFNYDPGDTVTMLVAGRWKMYQLSPEHNWDAVVSAANLEGVLSEEQLGVSIINTATFAQELSEQNPIHVLALPDLEDPDIQLQYPAGTRVAWTHDDEVEIYKCVSNAGILSWAFLTSASSVVAQLVAGQVNASVLTANEAWVDAIAARNLAADSVLARNIKAGEIQTNHMQANSIDGDRIMVNTLLANRISADWLDAGAIAAGAIGANELDVVEARAAILVADSILASMIKAGEIHTAHMAADSIDGDRITANTLNGDKIVANTITGAKFQAGSISTDKLIVGSFENLCEDGSFELPAASGAWSCDANGIAVTSTVSAHTGSACLRKQNGSGATSVATSRMVFDVKSADKIYFEGWVSSTAANGTAKLYVRFYTDRACTTPASGGASDYALAFSAAETANIWKFKAVPASPTPTAPADAKWARLSVAIEGHSSGTWHVDDVYIRKVVGSAYIDNLVADKITGGTLNCTNITVQNLNGVSLTGFSVGSDKLSIGGFDNLVEDGTCELSAASGAWGLDAAATVAGTLPRSGTQGLVFSGISGADVNAISRRVFAVQPGEIVYLEGWARNSAATGSLRFMVRFFQDRNCAIAASGGGSDAWVTASAAESGGSWVKKTVTSTAAPADARWARVYVSSTGQFSGQWFADDLFCTKKVQAAFIASVLADSITAGTLNCANVTVTNLSATAITAGTLNCANITVTNLNAASITAGQLTVDRINNQSYNPITLDTVISDNWRDGLYLGIRLHGKASNDTPFSFMHRGVKFVCPASNSFATPKANSYVTYTYVRIPNPLPAPGSTYNLVPASDFWSLNYTVDDPTNYLLICLIAYYPVGDPASIMNWRAVGSFVGDTGVAAKQFAATAGSSIMYTIPRDHGVDDGIPTELSMNFEYTGLGKMHRLKLSDSRLTFYCSRTGTSGGGRFTVQPVWDENTPGDYFPTVTLTGVDGSVFSAGGKFGLTRFNKPMPTYQEGATGGYKGYFNVYDWDGSIYGKVPIYY